MEPGSPVSPSSEPPSRRLPSIIGTLIALLTLTIPVAMIAYFSSASASPWQPSTYPALRQRP